MATLGFEDMDALLGRDRNAAPERTPSVAVLAAKA
jgi:hypothetical protein